jgi:RNA polymerase sigma-70 factor (ECF subfamily)
MELAVLTSNTVGEQVMFWFGIDLQWAYGNLLPVIFQQTRCRHSAYDVLHDALLRYALIAESDSIRQPHAYLRSIVSSVIIDNHRDMSRFVSINTENTEQSDPSGINLTPLMPENFAPSAEHLADLQQRLTALQTIIAALPNKCREVFWLYRIEGHSQREIAQRLGISLKMVEAHMARAMMSLNQICEQLIN